MPRRSKLKTNLENQRKAMGTRIQALRAEFENKRSEHDKLMVDEGRRKKVLELNGEHLKGLRTASGKEAGR